MLEKMPFLATGKTKKLKEIFHNSNVLGFKLVFKFSYSLRLVTVKAVVPSMTAFLFEYKSKISRNCFT